MEIWALQWIPRSFLLLLGPLSLIVIGYFVEKHYTGRITIAANAVALITYFSNFTTVPFWIILYTNVVTVLGIIGFASYVVKYHLFEQYYTVGVLASSIVTGLVLLYGAVSL